MQQFGAHSAREIPVLIPNTEVKPGRGDYTALRETSKVPNYQLAIRKGGFLYIIYSYGHSSGTASDSICPKGWRLPGYSGSGSWLESLQEYIVLDKHTNANIDAVLQLTPFSLTRAGRNAASNYRTLIGFYWSNYFSSISIAHYLSFTASGGLYPQDSYERMLGLSLRCLTR